MAPIEGAMIVTDSEWLELQQQSVPKNNRADSERNA
jgi:hypothetical protein